MVQNVEVGLTSRAEKTLHQRSVTSAVRSRDVNGLPEISDWNTTF